MMDLVSLNVRITLILRTDRVLKSYLTFKLTHRSLEMEPPGWKKYLIEIRSKRDFKGELYVKYGGKGKGNFPVYKS